MGGRWVLHSFEANASRAYRSAKTQGPTTELMVEGGGGMMTTDFRATAKAETVKYSGLGRELPGAAVLDQRRLVGTQLPLTAEKLAQAARERTLTGSI